MVRRIKKVWYIAAFVDSNNETIMIHRVLDEPDDLWNEDEIVDDAYEKKLYLDISITEYEDGTAE